MEQKAASAASGLEQTPQATRSDVPQFEQNEASSEFVRPQLGHSIARFPLVEPSLPTPGDGVPGSGLDRGTGGPAAGITAMQGPHATDPAHRGDGPPVSNRRPWG